jgi:hypothetical protein
MESVVRRLQRSVGSTLFKLRLLGALEHVTSPFGTSVPSVPNGATLGPIHRVIGKV